MQVSAVVRLNSKEYNREDFVRSGFNHYDLFFEDCTTPKESIVQQFMQLAEHEKGVIAIHCLAGLGRTGTLIALWIMRKYDFTAAEVIAYLRILRPGSIIGPQQQYLCSVYARMQNSNRNGNGQGAEGSEGSGSGAVNSEVLAREVKEGMLRRHFMRAASSEGAVVGNNAEGAGGVGGSFGR